MADYQNTEVNQSSAVHVGAHDASVEYDSKKDFTTLEAWKKSREVKVFFYREVIPLLPDVEKFNLNVQIRKAAVSATANIAEGYGRYHYQEGIQYYRVSRGSLYELKDHLISCRDIEVIDEENYRKGISLIEEAKATLNGFIRFVRIRKETS
jgi:four helix bundle protein